MSVSTEAVKPSEKVTEASKSGIDVTETTKSAEGSVNGGGKAN